MSSTPQTFFSVRGSARWLVALGLAGFVGCTTEGEVTGGEEEEFLTDERVESSLGDRDWRTEQKRRQAELDAYLANPDHQAQFKSFKDAPVGSSGVPMVMFRVFPELFSDIWGAPGSGFQTVGFATDPYDANKVLPLGLGFTGSVVAPGAPIVNVVTLTCMGCHGGRVQDASGKVITTIGSPNTQFDGFRTAILRTVNDPRYTADAFRAALASKPPGWLYGDTSQAGIDKENAEKGFFMAPGVTEQIIGTLKARANAGAQRFALTLGQVTYAVPNAPNPSGKKPGYLDAIGFGISIIVDPAVYTVDQMRTMLPPAPAEIDIMSVWKQGDRPTAQWDGSIASPIHRNLAAEFGVVGDPTKLNMPNAVLTTAFNDQLPSPVYPFDVNRASADRGKLTYDKYCASCHKPGNTNFYTPAQIGTDPNRANIWTDFSVAGLRKVLGGSCTATECFNEDGSPVPPEAIIQDTGAYMAVPLDGIWARAPYLHNGSVPTLRALLVPSERPVTFFRGNINYDTRNVGFVSSSAIGPTAALFDTRLSGASNAGHSSGEFLGKQVNGAPINWGSTKPADKVRLADLLEYMKTL